MFYEKSNMHSFSLMCKITANVAIRKRHKAVLKPTVINKMAAIILKTVD